MAPQYPPPPLAPRDVETYGTVRAGDLRVYVARSAYQALRDLASSAGDLERHAYLFGQDGTQSSGEWYLFLTHALPCRFAQATAVTVQPSPQDVAAAVAFQAQHPGLRRLGMAHTHPLGASAQQSETDRRTQRRIPVDWRASLIIAPRADGTQEWRFYAGPRGVPLCGCTVVPDPISEVLALQPIPVAGPGEAGPRARPNGGGTAVAPPRPGGDRRMVTLAGALALGMLLGALTAGGGSDAARLCQKTRVATPEGHLLQDKLQPALPHWLREQ